MPSPFPGFDPYIESQLNWLDFHTTFIVELSRTLLGTLPIGFVAEIDVYVSIVLPDSRKDGDGRTAAREGDVTIFTVAPPVQAGSNESVAVLERPAIATGDVVEPEISTKTRVRQRFLKIVDVRGDKPKVVAIIELLSPTNKGNGFTAYEKKQAQLLDSDVHLIEIDLLRSGEHTVFVPKQDIETYGTWNYLVTLRDISAPDQYAFWRIGLRDALPTILLPLTPDVPPVRFDLQASFDRCYQSSFYERRIDYKREPEPPLATDDAAWADELLQAVGLRP